MFKLNKIKDLLILDKVSPRELENIPANLEAELGKIDANKNETVKPKKYPKFGFRMWLAHKFMAFIALQIQ